MSHPNTALEKRFALLAGAALLMMAVLAPIAFFGFLEPTRVLDDSAAQVEAMQASEGMFRISIVIFLIVAVLDILVAWGLYGVFSSTHPQLSRLTAWFRLIYTAVLLVATASLVDALNRLQVPLTDTDLWTLQVQNGFDGFFITFNLGLGIFGCHLVSLGYLIMRSRVLPGFLGILVGIAGLGYLADTLGTTLISGYDLNLAGFTFIGEVLLIGGLFWIGLRRSTGQPEVSPSI